MNKKQICALCTCMIALNTISLTTYHIKIKNKYEKQIQNQKQNIMLIRNDKEKLIKHGNELNNNIKTLQLKLNETEDTLKNMQNQLYEKNKEIEKFYIKPNYCP